MRTPLAWRNVQHSRMRSFVALLGVSFALVLIFMQLGFRDAGRLSATLVYDTFDFDLMGVSPQYMFLTRSRSFPMASLERLRAREEVASVTPVWLGLGEWRSTGERQGWPMLVLASEIQDRPFLDPEINGQLARLNLRDTILTDRRSRPEFGPLEVGAGSELDGHRLDVVGRFTVGGGFVAGSTLITSDHTFERLFPGTDLRQVSFGLIKLKPGFAPAEVAARMNRDLDPEAKVLSREEISGYEQNFWMNIRPIGIMFTSGLLISMVAGAVILYQVLVSEVQNRLREYETLLALGYGPGYVYSVVLRQAVIFTALGYAPAVLISAGLYALLRIQALLPVHMVWSRLGLVFGLAMAICLSATFMAVRKLGAADPAGLFG